MKRVLVVEDDEAVRETLAEVLRLDGYAVATAEDGLMALELLGAAPPPDLILIDWMMPRLDGRALVDALVRNARWRAIPRIVVSAVADSLDAATRETVAAVFRKPFRSADLLDVVRERALGIPG